MNFFNRAVKNVTRSKTKSILLAITFFLIGNLVIIGLGVSYASENAKKLTRMKMKPAIQYVMDYESFWRYTRTLDDEEQNEAYMNMPRATFSTFQKIVQDEHVESANALYTAYAHAMDFSPIPGEEQNDAGILYEEVEDEAGVADYDIGYTNEYYQDDICIIANYFPDMIEFYEGTYEISSGRFYTQAEIDSGAAVCLITEDLAKANNFSVGDHISVRYVESWYMMEFGDRIEEPDIEYEIIGIYKNNKVVGENDTWRNNWAQYRLENQILAPATSIASKMLEVETMMFDYYAEMWPDDEYYTNPAYRPSIDQYMNQMILLLDDPLYVEDFIESKADILDPYTKLDANDTLFNTFAKPLDTMSLFANIIVWIVVINAIVIITLVTALTMKTREHEIGILLSMGVSKLKVVAQLFLELAIVAVLGFTLAIGSGSLISRNVGQMVLDYQVSSNDDDDYYYYYYSDSDSYFTNITQEDMLSEYEVTVNPLIIAEIYGLGLGVVLVATLIPSFMIMRFNPKKILTDTY